MRVSSSVMDRPGRPASAYGDLTTFPNDEQYDELVLCRDVPFHSLCQHHLPPFRGVAHIGYLPGERILGPSPLARVVELFSRPARCRSGSPGCRPRVRSA